MFVLFSMGKITNGDKIKSYYYNNKNEKRHENKRLKGKTALGQHISITK